MRREEAIVYGAGRLAFGVGLLVAPVRLGSLLVGDEAGNPTVRVGLRSYGTRDAVLGLCTLRAAFGGEDVRAWIAAGVAADVLDTALQLAEWDDLPRTAAPAGWRRRPADRRRTGASRPLPKSPGAAPRPAPSSWVEGSDPSGCGQPAR